MKKLLIIFSNTLFLVSLLFSGFLLLSKIQKFSSPKAFLVSSGSMEPAIYTGSLVITLPQKSYVSGDIVTFKSEPKSKITTTHRIVGVGGGYVKTAGDANSSPDSKLIKTENIVGKVHYIIPYLGYLAGFIQTPQGFILFVIVPATILVYEEFKSLISETKGFFLKKIKRPSSEIKRGVGGEVKKTAWIAILPIIFAGLIITSKSNSYFSDLETSSSNSITAWIPTPTLIPPSPTPTPGLTDHVVFSEIQIKGVNANQDFIEFYNPTSTSIDLSGWKIRVCNSNGNEDSLAVVPSGKNIPSHGFFLWSNNQGTFETDIGADISNGNSLSENYSLALKKPDDTLIDQIGWGNNTCSYFEGARYPDINNSVKSIERKAYWNSTSVDMISGGIHETKGNGFDGNNNSTDFISRSTGSNPQNSTSLAETP